MAGTLLHVALAEKALESAALDEKTRQEIFDRGADFRLGSVIFDLPYFDNLPVAGLRMLLGRPLNFDVWGTLLHLRSPIRFIAHLLESSRPGTAVVGLGALTHFAVDAVFHPEIHRRVMTGADGSKDLNSLHKDLEDDIDLHVFDHLLGHTGVGTGYCARKLVMRPSAGWAGGVEEAVFAVHRASPSAGQLMGWLCQVGLYGVLSSSPRAPWVKTSPRLVEVAHREAAVALGEEAVSLAARYLAHGAALVRGRVGREELFGAISDRNLLDGGPAQPPRAGVST